MFTPYPQNIEYLVGWSLPFPWTNQVVSGIAAMTLRYPGILLPKTQEQIAAQLEMKDTVVAGIIYHRAFTLVGFVTLYDLGVDVFELGTLTVLEEFQGQGVGTELVRTVIEYNGEHRIIATAKTSRAIRALIHGGMSMREFNFLPESVRAATCCCTNSGEGGILCPKADRECRLLIANWKQ